MTTDIACPACGERDRLRGAREGNLILLTCAVCGERWERDPRPACPKCGGRDLVEARKAMMEKVRGDQASIVGYTKVRLCRVCDAALIESLATTKAPLPPDVMPVVSRHSLGRKDRPRRPADGKAP